MAYIEQLARSFSLLVSAPSLSLTKSLQLIVFAVVVLGVTDVFCGCVECNVTYDEDSNACAVKCEPLTNSAAVKVNNKLLENLDQCLNPPIWNKPYCLWKENGLSVGAKIKSDLGRFSFKYDPGIVSCDNEWCELDIEFVDGTCSGVEVSGSTCRKSENAPGFVPSVTPSATPSVVPNDPPGGNTPPFTPNTTPSVSPSAPPSDPTAIALGVSLLCLGIFLIILMIVGCYVNETQTRVLSRCFCKLFRRSSHSRGDGVDHNGDPDVEHDGKPEKMKSIKEAKKTR